MFGRLLAVWYLCEAPNPNAVRIICVANCGVSTTLRGKFAKPAKFYKIKKEKE